MFARVMQLWRSEDVAFATPEIGRFFLGCRRCARVVPQYRCYGSQDEAGVGLCRCGNNTFSPMVIPEWRAALWLLGCYVWRKQILKKDMWDPRIAVRKLS
jgi:hypothetical protein